MNYPIILQGDWIMLNIADKILFGFYQQMRAQTNLPKHTENNVMKLRNRILIINPEQ